jgi:hypothetical protein
VSRSGLANDWDFKIKEKEVGFRDDLGEASGIGRKRKRVSELSYACFFAKTPTERPNDGASPLSTSICGQVIRIGFYARFSSLIK